MLWLCGYFYQHECLAAPEHRSKEKAYTILFVMCFLDREPQNLISDGGSEIHSHLMTVLRLPNTLRDDTATATGHSQVVSEDLPVRWLSNSCSQLKTCFAGSLFECTSWKLVRSLLQLPGAEKERLTYPIFIVLPGPSKSSDAGKGPPRWFPA